MNNELLELLSNVGQYEPQPNPTYLRAYTSYAKKAQWGVKTRRGLAKLNKDTDLSHSSYLGPQVTQDSTCFTKYSTVTGKVESTNDSVVDSCLFDSIGSSKLWRTAFGHCRVRGSIDARGRQHC